MALDKQKILNELGSVVNQLQSADCGCMGKLFNSGQRNNANMGGCCHGHGGGGFNAPCGGEPCQGPRHCMGFCNPPKLYADTYSYLNQNLMQPVIKEVYDDLKSISPQNAIGNNPLAAQMGLSASGPNPAGAGRAGGNMPGAMGGQMGGNMPGSMGGQMGGNMLGSMGGQMGGNMPGSMGGQMGGNMPGSMGGQMGGNMPGSMGSQMGGNMPGAMGGQMGGNMPGSMGGNTPGAIGGQMGGNTPGAMGGQMGSNMPDMAGNMGGNFQNPVTPRLQFATDSINGNNVNMNNLSNRSPMGMANMAGMGPQILNMMKGDGAKFDSVPNQGGDPSNRTGMGNAPQATPMSGDMQAGSNGQFGGGMSPYNSGNAGGPGMGMNSFNQGMPGNMMRSPTMENQSMQNMSQPGMYGAKSGANPNAPGNMENGYSNQISPASRGGQHFNANPVHQQMNPVAAYGQHSAGMAKFNEMFPGVMTGELGFDPMAIAIQMNPANKQQAAIDTMQKLMTSNNSGINRIADTSGNASIMQPVINATNTAVANIAQGNQPQGQIQAPGQQNVVSGTVQQPLQQQSPSQQLQPPQQLRQQPTTVPVSNQMPTQQVYTALAGQPTMNQQYQQQLIDPNTGREISNQPQGYDTSRDPNAPQLQHPSPAASAPAPQKLDPILPVDTSKNVLPDHLNARAQKYYYYNTLGQPCEMVPAQVYHQAPPNLPQTLSPSPERSRPQTANYSNVKSTVSKTSIMGMDRKGPGKTPSRSQLQHLYNQYKGSQSYTQQNINTQQNVMPERGPSFSEGNLNVPQQVRQPQRYVPVEKVGGDTGVNNRANLVPINEQVKGDAGDIPSGNKPSGEGEMSAKMKNYRNGLQDMVYTSYPTSTSWTFHGENVPFRPYYPRRYRGKA